MLNDVCPFKEETIERLCQHCQEWGLEVFSYNLIEDQYFMLKVELAGEPVKFVSNVHTLKNVHALVCEEFVLWPLGDLNGFCSVWPRFGDYKTSDSLAVSFEKFVSILKRMSLERRSHGS